MRVIPASLATLIPLAALAFAAPACSQSTGDPFPEPIPRTEGALLVGFAEFAILPELGGAPARMMLLIDEPVTQKIFVNDMRGPLYRISYDGKSVLRYLDVNSAQWEIKVQSQGRERGFQSFAFHPQFGQAGTPGYGKFYTWTDTENTQPTPDFRPGGGTRTHDTVLLEWTSRSPAGSIYDGAAPRELMRIEQPFANHNAGRLSFNPLATPGSADYGLLYVGLADGGSAGDPIGNAQRLTSPFGKIMRIDPLGRNSKNGKYGIPAANPFASDSTRLGEIYAYGIRNSQHFAWDRATGRMIITDIGQNTVEELDVLTPGANLGWNVWEGSFRYVGREGVSTEGQRGDPAVTYPIAEYDQADSLFQPQSAITGLVVYRSTQIPQLANVILFGDLPSGEIFYVSAESLPSGGQSPIHRVLLNQGGEARTLLEVIRTRAAAQGKQPPARADLRMHPGPGDRVFLLDKADGVIRVLVPDGG